MTLEEQVRILSRGAEEILPEGALLERLRQCQRERWPLRVKQGFDPTAPDIHLGHTVGLRKLRTFQDLGHQVVLIVGDYTGMVGDPSGRSKTRPQLGEAEVEANARTYLEQFYRVLDATPSSPRLPVEVHRNGQWFSRMRFAEVIRLASHYTVARMLERDDFAQRYQAQQPISIHELLYPLMQGYDSVAMKADVELGGTDQKFNLLVGRELQKDYGQEPQCVLTTPLLEGLDGVNKMSKSLGNYVGIAEAPGEIFGKLMSISDDLMWRYIELLSFEPLTIVRQWRSEVEAGANPRDVKIRFAKEIVARFHSRAAAERAEEEFAQRFRHGQVPENMPEVTLQAPAGGLAVTQALKQAGLVPSVTEAARNIEQGGVKLDGERLANKARKLAPGETVVAQVGKRKFSRIRIT